MRNDSFKNGAGRRKQGKEMRHSGTGSVTAMKARSNVHMTERKKNVERLTEVDEIRYVHDGLHNIPLIL